MYPSVFTLYIKTTLKLRWYHKEPGAFQNQAAEENARQLIVGSAVTWSEKQHVTALP